MKMNILKAIKRFRGIAFDLLEIRVNSWDGYGFTFFKITWLWVRTVTHSDSVSLVTINWVKRYEYGGEEWKLFGGILFFSGNLYTWVIKPRKKECLECGELCETTDYYFDNKPYCSEWCRESREQIESKID